MGTNGAGAYGAEETGTGAGPGAGGALERVTLPRYVDPGGKFAKICFWICSSVASFDNVITGACGMMPFGAPPCGIGGGALGGIPTENWFATPPPPGAWGAGTGTWGAWGTGAGTWGAWTLGARTMWKTTKTRKIQAQ